MTAWDRPYSDGDHVGRPLMVPKCGLLPANVPMDYQQGDPSAKIWDRHSKNQKNGELWRDIKRSFLSGEREMRTLLSSRYIGDRERRGRGFWEENARLEQGKGCSPGYRS